MKSILKWIFPINYKQVNNKNRNERRDEFSRFFYSTPVDKQNILIKKIITQSSQDQKDLVERYQKLNQQVDL
ncbi:MAG: hypothetical protein R3B41_01505 [Candidatus Doudnabacteria bacterium]